MAKLTAKQEMFVIAYVKCLNATQAYKEAYGTENDDTARVNASKLLTKTNIKTAIDNLMANVKSDKVASAEEVLEFLTEVMTNKDEAVSNRLRSAELLGKRYKLFTDKVEVDANVEVEINLTGLDDEEDE